jgi:hypothetical protein
MKTNLTILLFLILTNSYGQEKYYNWFDMNLKGKPTYVKEISIYSLADLTSKEYEFFLDTTLNNFLAINEYYFDMNGYVSREIHKNFFEDYNSGIDTLHTIETIEYKDSIVTKKFFVGKQLVDRTVKIFDKNGYLERILLEGYVTGSIIYKRDSKNQIKTIFENLTGIDTSSKTKISLKRNDFGDVTCKKTESEQYTAIDNSNEKKESIENYQYIYDTDNNWIIRTTFENDSLTLITQRIIKK